MNLNIVQIDTLTPDGILTSFKITPKQKHKRVLIDRVRDIRPDRFGDELDLGGTRIYNSKECSILRTDTGLRTFDANEKDISFQFEHLGIPLGPSNRGNGGIYNFILAPGFRLIDLYIVDPYDNNHENIKQKKQFEYKVIWDNECKMQLVEMFLRSNRGSFSFIVCGSFALTDSGIEHNFLEAQESDRKVSEITSGFLLKKMLQDDGKKILAKGLSKKLDWLELKLTFCGLGLDLRKILQDCSKVFKRKIEKD